MGKGALLRAVPTPFGWRVGTAHAAGAGGTNEFVLACAFAYPTLVLTLEAMA